MASDDELEQVDRAQFDEIKSGNTQAFSSFVRKYQNWVFNFCYSYLKDAAVAQDIAQETFVKFYKALGRIQNPGKIESYMFRIARNLCLDFLRKNRREKLVPHISTKNNGTESIHNFTKPDLNTPEKILLEKEDCQSRERLCRLVNEKMESLSTDKRVAIDLVHFKGLSYKKAAEILECAEGTVKSRVNRGILELGRLVRSSHV